MSSADPTSPPSGRSAPGTALPSVAGVLAVCAHPDDESFGLGAIIGAFTDTGVPVAVLSFTHGEASTLHAKAGALAALRAGELTQAAAQLGVDRTELLTYPDGRLADQPLDELAAHVRRLAEDVEADTLLVFDLGGITGHPDHQRATDAALTAAADGRFSVLAWALPDSAAHALNTEFGTAFVGRADHDVDIVFTVDRRRQLAAIRRHASQSIDNPVVWRRLELQGDAERLRWLETDGTSRPDGTTRPARIPHASRTGSSTPWREPQPAPGRRVPHQRPQVLGAIESLEEAARFIPRHA